MKYKLRLLKIRAQFFLRKINGRRILRFRTNNLHAVATRAYIQTFTLFPDEKLAYNEDLSWCVRNKLFDIPEPTKIQKLNQEHVDVLYDSLLTDDIIRGHLSKYHLTTALYFSWAGLDNDINKNLTEEPLKKAKLYSSNARPISQDDAKKSNRETKKEIKKLIKQAKALGSERIETEKSNLIKPIEITSSHVLFLASLFSTLFLISGFAYTKIFFMAFDINVGDFFTLSDYMASSIDSLIPVVISSILGIAFFVLGASDALSREVYEEQFETRLRDGDYLFPIILVSSTVGLVITSYTTGKLSKEFLFPLIFFIGLYFFLRLPVWKYLKNTVPVGAVIGSVLYFSMHLGFKVNDSINEAKSTEYKSSYLVYFNKEYEAYSDYIYLYSSSNYIFLLEKHNNSVSVLPRSAIKAISVRKDS